MTNTPNERRIHQGRNIKKFREMLGIKQEALALELATTEARRKSASSKPKR